MESRLQILNNLSVAVIALNHRQCVEWLNPAAETLLQTSNRFCDQQPLSAVVILPDELPEQIDDALATGQSLIYRHLALKTRLHSTILVDCIITPVQSADQQMQLILEMLDVDRQQRIAAEREILEQQEHSQRILRGFAHEVLNPLGGIRGAAQLLEQELGKSKLTEYTQLLIKETDRLRNLMRRMLGPNTQPKLEQHNIHEILIYVSKLLLQDNPHKVRTIFDYDPSIPDLQCDREKLVQVFINLASNALIALKDTDSPQITIKSRVERNFTIRGKLVKLVCKIHIIDNGPGVPDEITKTLFYPMVSGKPGGTGLGLSIAQSLVIQQGGLIECHSLTGHTDFEVTLPVLPGQ
jgi:two-component system nitrogen regulation sensor histidine kinase GlnL